MHKVKLICLVVPPRALKLNYCGLIIQKTRWKNEWEKTLLCWPLKMEPKSRSQRKPFQGWKILFLSWSHTLIILVNERDQITWPSFSPKSTWQCTDFALSGLVSPNW